MHFIIEYFLYVHNKLFPHGNMYPTFVFVCPVVKTDGHTNTHFPNLKFEHEKMNQWTTLITMNITCTVMHNAKLMM